MRSADRDKMYFYEEQFSGEFDKHMNRYDLNKRLEVVFDEMLPSDLSGNKLLDAGCGTGWFSKAAYERNAHVVSMDLGENLLKEVAKKCPSETVVGSILDMPFDDNSFDIVVSSEVVEHVPDPFKAIDEMYRVLKPGGTLVLTTPNKLWYFSLWIAHKLNVRRYQGLENWLSRRELRNHLLNLGCTIESIKGIHLFPFVINALNPVLDFAHRFNDMLGPLMLNMAIKCKKNAKEK